MARAIRGRKKTWERPGATIVQSKFLNSEEDDVCIDDEENIKVRNTDVDHPVTGNVQNSETCQLFESDTELKEEYKQLLVKAVAERLKRKLPEDEMWKEIERETGYNHKNVWNEMQTTVKNKIMRLIPANDLLENIPTEMQLSQSDWLLFDNILVHEQIDVIGSDFQSEKEEPQCLQELFKLVKQYDVERLVGEALMEAWARLTAQYNSSGRQCSPMMLQLRWYQMKKLTRTCFYYSYANNKNQDIHKTESKVVLTVLKIEIAVTYNTVITKNCRSWETLITEKRVILSEEFTAAKPLHYENKPNFNPTPAPEAPNEPMLLLIKLDENQMEDYDKIKTSEGSNSVTDDTIVIDLKHDKEFITALQKVIDKSTNDGRTKPQVEVKNPEDSDDFKLLLTRELANRKLTNSLWDMLHEKLQPKRDWKRIWIRMRNTTAKKIQKSLQSNDVLQNISPAMRLSEAEWLLFDLVLVHQKINCISYESLEKTCVRDLFKLVVEYDVENLIGEKLVEAWINLTLKYNSGCRMCSPMLLQLRWHQLKEITRQQVYNPHMYPYQTQSKMLISIAAKYQKIILQDLLTWTTLVTEKHVVLPEDFIRVLKQNDKWKEIEATEGWYLHIKKEVSGPEMNTIDDDVCIVPDVSSSDTENKSDKIVQQRLQDRTNLLTITKLSESKKNEIIDLDSDDELIVILKEKTDKLSDISQKKVKNILNISKTHLESKAPHANVTTIDKSKNPVNVDVMHKKVTEPTISNNEPILCDSDDEMDKILQEKANLMSFEFEIDEFKNMSSKINGMEVEEMGIIKKEAVKTDDVLDEADLDENNIEFADDGIKLEEGSEYTTKKVELTTGSPEGTNEETDRDDIKDEDTDDDDKRDDKDTDDENDTDGSNDNPEIDPKLLMDTKVYTKKIDCLEVFKFIDYESLRDKRLIEHVENQNKAVGKRAIKNEYFQSRQQPIWEYEDDSVPSDTDDETQFPDKDKIKNTKRLLQKGIQREYAFRTLSRNTVSEIENFKNQKSTIESPSIPGMLTEDLNMKLAEHVRDLIATITSDGQDESDSMTNEVPKIPVRSKVINLPDKDQIRLLNQSLLTAEITPTHQPLLNLSTVNTTSSNDSGPSRIICSLEEPPNKRLKTDLGTSAPWSSNKPIYCCWAREKIAKTQENSALECSKHMCVGNCCTCCCRADLVVMKYPKRISLRTTNTTSTNINGVNVNNGIQSKVNENSSSNTYVSSITKLKDALLNTNNTNSKPTDNNVSFKTNLNHGEIFNKITVVRNSESKEGNSSNTFLKKTKVLNYTLNSTDSKNIRKAPECTRAEVNHQPIVTPSTSFGQRASVAATPSYRKILPRLPVNSSEKSGFIDKVPQKSELPVKVLQKSGLPVNRPQSTQLTVISPQKSGLPDKHPGNFELAKGLQKPMPTYVVLPSGVNFVQLDGQVALAINPGIELEPAQLQKLISLCASVNNSLQLS